MDVVLIRHDGQKLARLELSPKVRRRGGRSDARCGLRRERITQRRGTATGVSEEKFSTGRAASERASSALPEARPHFVR